MKDPVTPFSEGAVGFVRRVFGPAATEIGETLADQVRAYRARNLRKILDRAQSKTSGRETNALPPRFSIPLLENASLEDDESLQEMWANLIENASEEIRDDHYLMRDILSNLTPNSADLLRKIVGKFHLREEWYSELSWESNWLMEIEKHCRDEIEHRLADWHNGEEGFEIAREMMGFHVEKPIWVFHVDLPAVIDDVIKRVEEGEPVSEVGIIYMPFSVENPSLNILEKNGLVLRKKHEFELTYVRVGITYAVATTFAVDFVMACIDGGHKTTISEKEE